MLWLLLSPVLAADCKDTLSVRSVRPVDRQVDVPLDVRVLVSLIGWGTAEEVTVRLVDDQDSELDVSTETWCYEHEGPHEVHCWFRLTPVEPLAADTTHDVLINSSEVWAGTGHLSQTTSFTTGSGAVAPTGAPPTLTLDSRSEDLETGPCDYANPRRYMLMLTGAETDATGLGVFHLDQVFPDGASEALRVHTVHVFEDRPDTDVKQYLDAGEPTNECYQVTYEDGAGRLTPGDVACWESDTGPPDSGVPDTSAPDSGTLDTSALDSGTLDTSAPDSGPPDSGASDSGTPGAEPGDMGQVSESGCGCAASPGSAPFLPLLGVLLLVQRTRRTRRPGSFGREPRQ